MRRTCITIACVAAAAATALPLIGIWLDGPKPLYAGVFVLGMIVLIKALIVRQKVIETERQNDIDPEWWDDVPPL